MESSAVVRRPTGPLILVRVGAALAIGLLLALLALPLLALLFRIPPSTLIARLGDPLVTDALVLSLITSSVSTIVVLLLGLPVAYLHAYRQFRGKRLVELLVDLPMVLPPTGAGLALLLAFGRMGLAGRALGAFGIHLPFTTLGVIVAQSFMAAPFFVGTARAGFSSIEPRYLDAASTLRASPAYQFFRVILPLSFPSLIAGAAMSGARAMGEFGATITFAGNLPGTTQTMPIAVYMALQTDLDAAVTLSVLLMIVSITLLLALRSFRGGLLWSPSSARSGRS
jgi:molybdate transport system permease protein